MKYNGRGELSMKHNGLGVLSMTAWQMKDPLQVQGHEFKVRYHQRGACFSPTAIMLQKQSMLDLARVNSLTEQV